MNISQADYKLIDVDYRVPKPIQGNFKTLNPDEEQKLLRSYKQKQIFRPALSVWKSPEDDVFYLMDGHQTQSLFKKYSVTIDGGHIIKALLIIADSLVDAKEKLLIINSEYGEKDYQGFMTFAKGMNIDWIEGMASFKIKGMNLSQMKFDFNQRLIQQSKAQQHFIAAPPVQTGNNTPPATGTPPPSDGTGSENQNNQGAAHNQSFVKEITTKKDQAKTEIGRPTDDHHTRFNRVMSIGSYNKLIFVLNHIRLNLLPVERNDLSHSLEYMCDQYLKVNNVEYPPTPSDNKEKDQE